MKKYSILFLIICIVSCNKDNNEVPCYISIDDIQVNEYANSAGTNVTDAWVYINDNLQGVYELPARFPVLAQGKQKLRIRAGIKDNGIAATRVAYPFYSSFIIEDQDFSPEMEIMLEPVVSYIENTNFYSSYLIEDEGFEGNGINLEPTLISDTTIIEITEGGNKYGAGILTDSFMTFEIATEELDSLPQQGAPVYLELDYMSNTQFLVGLYVNFPQGAVLQKDLLWVTPKEEWNKIYINLTSSISESIGAESFKVFIGMKRDFDQNINSMYFDNFKVVY